MSENNKFCKKRIDSMNKICLSFHESLDYSIQKCPYGFSCYRDEKSNEIYYGYLIKNYYDLKKINGHIRNSKDKDSFDLSIYSEKDFLKNVVENPKYINIYIGIPFMILEIFLDQQQT